MDASALVLAHSRAALAESLGREFPYLKTEALNEPLQKSEQLISSTIKEQEPVMEATKSPTSFLSLSAELRNRIYHLAITPRVITITRKIPHPHVWKDARKPPGYIRYPISQQPAISKVCREIRGETLPMYYGLNIFKAQITSALPKSTSKVIQEWLEVTGPSNARMIRKLELKVNTREDLLSSLEELGTDYFQILGFAAAGLSRDALKVALVPFNGIDEWRLEAWQ